GLETGRPVVQRRVGGRRGGRHPAGRHGRGRWTGRVAGALEAGRRGQAGWPGRADGWPAEPTCRDAGAARNSAGGPGLAGWFTGRRAGPLTTGRAGERAVRRGPETDRQRVEQRVESLGPGARGDRGAAVHWSACPRHARTGLRLAGPTAAAGALVGPALD